MTDKKFRALVETHLGEKVWEYYTTFREPAWMDSVKFIAKDLQFIGLRDKRGKEIYEGDIIKVTFYRRYNAGGRMEEHIAEVAFSSGSFWWRSKEISENCWFHYNESQIEILGNIYENFELLKPNPVPFTDYLKSKQEL